MEVGFTKVQEAIIVGTLLGDGSLEWNKFKGSRLQLKQSRPKKQYVEWLYQNLFDFVRTPPKERLDTNQWYFSTRSLHQLENLRKIFYRDRIKIVPDNIASLLISPLSLAVWFMDDGSLDYRKGYHYSFSLSTDSFKKDEVKLLQKVLFERFGVITSIQNPACRGKRYNKLYIGKLGRDKFLEIIRPNILECFSYKLPPIM